MGTVLYRQIPGQLKIGCLGQAVSAQIARTLNTSNRRHYGNGTVLALHHFRQYQVSQPQIGLDVNVHNLVKGVIRGEAVACFILGAEGDACNQGIENQIIGHVEFDGRMDGTGQPILGAQFSVQVTAHAKECVAQCPVLEPRQQINLLSSYIDGSNVYGADAVRAAGLRLFDGTGRLKFTIGPNGEQLLPYNTMGFDNAMLPFQQQAKMFVAGDVRCNEHNILTCLHTLFMREHNRLCLSIIADDITLEGKDEVVYQRARKIVGAQMQVITYNEFLPTLLGKKAIPKYKGYNAKTNSSIMNIFSTASYRLGHSMVSDSIKLGKDDKLPLRQAFFSPRRIELLGIEPFLEGAALQIQQEVDARAVDGLRSFLFFAPNANRKILNDLAALNIQRGRDHGLPDYNTVRKHFRLAPKKRFVDVTDSVSTRRGLDKAYDGEIEAIDPWLGGLAEAHVGDANVGELIYTILVTQFIRLRDGDRFWYQNDPALKDMESELSDTCLSTIIKRNTGIRKISKDVFRK